MLFILHLPIRAIRIVTDPAVDLVVYVITDVLIPPYLKIVKTIAQRFMQLSFWIVSESLGEDKGSHVQESCYATVCGPYVLSLTENLPLIVFLTVLSPPKFPGTSVSYLGFHWRPVC